MIHDAHAATYAAIQDRFGTEEAVRYVLLRCINRPGNVEIACTRLGWTPEKLWSRLGRRISLDLMSNVGYALGLRFEMGLRRRAVMAEPPTITVGRDGFAVLKGLETR